MESRSAYGYYGEGHGATGEMPPETEKDRGGYQMNLYSFLVDWHMVGISNKVEVRAKSFKNAERNVKAWAKRDGGTYIGEDPEWIKTNHCFDKD